ncbi:MAG: hypothetical protein RR455_05240, partial [Bacteroidales bacterium]
IGVRKIRNHELRECAGRSPNEKEGVVFLQLDLEEISVKKQAPIFLGRLEITTWRLSSGLRYAQLYGARLTHGRMRGS